MKKEKVAKVFNIIILCLVIAIGVACVVLYLVNPDLCKKLIKYTIEVLNKPLPIVGVTTAAVLLFVWKLVITTNYGKAKLVAYETKIKEIEKAKEDFVENANSELAKLKEENDKLRYQLSQVCGLSTNKKIKDFGKDLLEYGKETIDGNTKEE